MNRNGNVLFLILIAVALFAALTYAVTQSSRGGGNIDREQGVLASSGFVNDAILIRNTIKKMQGLNGCSDLEISFWNDSDGNGTENASDDYYNANALGMGNACHIFDANGGGLTPPSPGDNLSDGTPYLYTEVQIEDVGEGSNDLVMIASNVDLVTCQAHNDSFDNGFTQNPPQDTAVGYGDPFDGVYDNIFIIGNSSHNLEAQKTACYEGGGTPAAGTYHIYYTLIER